MLRKELRQHWLTLLLLAFMTLAGYGLIVVSGAIAGDEGSVFVGVRLFVMILVSLCAMVLCHRLVVIEYSGRTQLFLEGLPVSRWRMVAVKYVLGLVLILSMVAIALGAACLLGGGKELFSPRYLAIVGVRAMSAALCAYQFFFVMGFLGRYRLALYLAALLGCFALDELTDLELGRFGPFLLLDKRFAFERDQFPWEALLVTWGLSAAFLALAFLLAAETGLTLDQFWTQWQEELLSARGELAAELAQLPKVLGEVTFLPLSAESRQIRYHIRIEPAPDNAHYSFLHHQLPVFDEEVAPQSIRREQNFYPQRPEGELPDTVARGTRLYWTFSLDVPALGCPVISGWRRDAIR